MRHDPSTLIIIIIIRRPQQQQQQQLVVDCSGMMDLTGLRRYL